MVIPKSENFILALVRERSCETMDVHFNSSTSSDQRSLEILNHTLELQAFHIMYSLK